MAGTKQGGLKAAQKNLANNPNFYAEIGAKSGTLPTLASFMIIWSKCRNI